MAVIFMQNKKPRKVKEVNTMPREPGRPTKYKEEYNEQAYKLCLLGATDKDIANFFSVEEQTINNWKNDYPEFFESLKAGKLDADAKVAQSLYNRATGYEQDTVKVFQFQGDPIIVPVKEKVAADTTAAIFWLKNRQPKQWRDKQDLDLSVKEMPQIVIKRSE